MLHGISPSGHPIDGKQFKGNTDPLFYESMSQNGKLTPRSVHIDTQPSVIDQIKQSKYNKLFNKNQMVSGKQDAANNYIRGHYTIGKNISDESEEKIRHQIEKMDFVQGIMVTHSINGGTGSGLSSLIAQRLSVTYPKKDKINLFVYPSQKFCDTVVQTYNAVLSEYSDLAIPMTDQRMYEIMENQFEVQNPTYSNINYLIAQTASNITSGSRFQGYPWSIKDLINNLVPYPRIHFVLNLFNQFLAKSYSKYEKQNLTSNNCCIDIGTFNQRYLSTFLMYRTPQLFQSREIERQICWLDLSNIKIGKCDQPVLALKNTGFETLPLSCNMLSINLSIDHIFSRINHKFDRMYAKNAFVHWYVGQGLDQGFFQEARQDLAALEKDFEDGSDVNWDFYMEEDYEEQPQ